MEEEKYRSPVHQNRRAHVGLIASFKYQSKLPQIEELLVRRFAEHFEDFFGLIGDWSNKSENQELKRSQILEKFDRFIEVYQPHESMNETISQSLILFALALSGFKATQLSDSKMKSRDLLQVISKGASYFKRLPDTASADPSVIGELLIHGNFKPVIELLRGPLHCKHEVARKIADLLTERMNFVSEIIYSTPHSFNSEGQFYSQVDRANQLISNITEVPGEQDRNLYLEILHLLGKDLNILYNFAGQDALGFIKGYLIYIDPFRNDKVSFEEIQRYSENRFSSVNILISMLSENTETVDILENMRAQLHQTVYLGAYIYSAHLEKVRKRDLFKGESGMTMEQYILQDTLNYFVENKVDFFTAKPFIDRALDITRSQGTINSPEYSELTSLIRSIAERTVNSKKNKNEFDVTKNVFETISEYLKAQGLRDEAQRLGDLFFAQQSKHSSPENTVDALIASLSQASFGNSLEHSLDCIRHLFKDKEIEDLISREFNPLTSPSDLERIRVLNNRLGDLKQGEWDSSNKALAFLEKYVEIRIHLSLITTGFANEARESYTNKLTALATEFGSIPVLYKLIFSTLIGYRLYFLGSCDTVDELMRVNSKTKRHMHVLHNLPNCKDDVDLLQTITNTAGRLLLEMRANCMN